jgi:hypothetical protein
MFTDEQKARAVKSASRVTRQRKARGKVVVDWVAVIERFKAMAAEMYADEPQIDHVIREITEL